MVGSAHTIHCYVTVRSSLLSREWAMSSKKPRESLWQEIEANPFNRSCKAGNTKTLVYRTTWLGVWQIARRFWFCLQFFNFKKHLLPWGLCVASPSHRKGVSYPRNSAQLRPPGELSHSTVPLPFAVLFIYNNSCIYEIIWLNSFLHRL